MSFFTSGSLILLITLVVLLSAFFLRVRHKLIFSRLVQPRPLGHPGRRYALNIAVICLLFLIAIFLIERRQREQAITSFQNLQLSDARQSAEQIQQHIKVIQAQLNVLAQNPNIISMNDEGKALLQAFYQFSEKPGIRAISRISPEMKIIYTTPYEQFVNTDVSNQPHHRKVANDHKDIISDPFQAVQGFRAIAIVEPVFDKAQFKGSIGVLVDFNSIASKCLDTAATGNISTVGLVSNSGVILIDPNPGLIGQSVIELGKRFPSLAKRWKQATQIEFGTARYSYDWQDKNKIRTTHKVAAFAHVNLERNQYWVIHVSANEKDILANAKTINWPEVVLALLVIVTVLLATFERIGADQRYARTLESEIAARLADLRRSEILFQQVFNQSTIGLLLLDPQGRLLNANDSCCAMFGRNQEQLKQDNALPDENWQRADIQSAILAALAGQTRIIETQYVSPNADSSTPRTLQFRVNVHPILDDQGAPTHVLIACEDITERKQAQKNLERMNRALKTLSSCNKALVHAQSETELLQENCRIMTDIGGYKLAWIGLPDPENEREIIPAAQSCLGSKEDWIVLKRDAQSPSYKAFHSGEDSVLQNVQQESVPGSWQQEVSRHDIASLMALPLKDGARVIGTLSVGSSEPNAFNEEESTLMQELANDLAFGIMTQRQRAEHQLAEQARMLLATAVDQATEAIIITDTAGTIEYINPAFSTLTGYTAEETLGRKPSMLKSDRQNRRLYQHVWNTIIAGKPWSGHFINRRKDGSIYEIESTISPVRDGAGQLTHFVAVDRDVTQELALEAQLQQAQKMEAIGKLAGGIAHDFNNLLTAMIGNMNLAQLQASPESQHYLQEAIQASERASDLVHQLLTFARNSQPLRQIIELESLVDEVASLIRTTFDPRLTLTVHRTEELPLVLADPSQIHQVLMNLCVNARDAVTTAMEASPEPTRAQSFAVTMEAHAETIDEDYCLLHADARPGRYVVISISDNGIGMDKETLARIFEPFFTTKGKDKGTGLGLAMVYGIVKNHHGWIEVTSTPGEGATFKTYWAAMDMEADNASQSTQAEQLD